MRNFKEYPLTEKEIFRTIELMRDSAFEERVSGDLRPLVLMQIEHFLEKNIEQFREYLIDYEKD